MPALLTNYFLTAPETVRGNVHHPHPYYSNGTLFTTGFSYDPYGRVVFYHWNGMVARGLISDGVYYYNMDADDGHYLGQFPVR